MPHLLLIRHSTSLHQPDAPAAQWPLSAEGEARAARFAQQVLPYHPAVIVASAESKAMQTGQILAAELGITMEVAADLHEHERPAVRFLERAEFERQVTDFFAHPTALVFGAETAAQTEQRFTHAVQRVVAAHPDQTLAVVTHGTVMALFLARRMRQTPFALWQAFTMPCMVALTLPDLRPVTAVVHCSPIEIGGGHLHQASVSTRV